MYRRLRVGALIAALVVALLPRASALGQDAGRLRFRARVSELLLQTSSYAKSKGPGDCVEVELPGRLNRPPVSVGLIERSVADWSTPERALESVRSANTAGDRGWILENFIAEERKDLASLVDDPGVLARSQDHFKSIQTMEITGSAELRGYTVLLARETLTERRVRIVAATFVKTASGWRQTNALSSDDAFDVVWAALRADKVQGRTLGSC